jgi:glycine dehydrogenase subunit 2
MHQEEKLLYEQSTEGKSGVDLPPLGELNNCTGQQEREEIGLPEVSESTVVRHFVRLSQQNFSIDSNFYPLGSCTMKHNPRLNEQLARLDGFANIHPLQPENSVQGALELMYHLQEWLCMLTGLPGCSLVPSAGAHGEFTGAMMIRKAHLAKGDPREIILVPDSAHGTNPATAAMCGYRIQEVPSTREGVVDMNALNTILENEGSKIAAFMLTNPNTCGIFEPNIMAISKKIHDIGAYFYCDGANFNAIMGKVLPGDLGIDIMQFNLHKTFSTPHGGGGPGSGPVVVAEHLIPFLPVPVIEKNESGYTLNSDSKKSMGRIRSFHGQFGMMVRALAYMQSHGADGLKKVAEDAVLNANYVLHHLKDDFHVPYSGYCMHECLLTDKQQKEYGVTTKNIAKLLLDKNIHPMTVYFPLIVNGAMLIEPTETETRETLDNFITVMKEIALSAKGKNLEKHAHDAPYNQPKKLLDEVLAARNPVLSYEKT